MIHWAWLIVAFVLGWVARPEKKESNSRTKNRESGCRYIK